MSGRHVNHVVGRVVEIGNVAALDGKPGIVIECEKKGLRALTDNFAGAAVTVMRVHQRVEKPHIGEEVKRER